MSFYLHLLEERKMYYECCIINKNRSYVNLEVVIILEVVSEY